MKRPESSQKGVVLLLLLLVFLVAGSSMMLGTFNNRQDLYLRQQIEISEQLSMAKDALLAFAANSSAIYNNTRGPGFFPCPETMDPDNGMADVSCTSSPVHLGRLPRYIDISPDNKIFFNSFYAGMNRQFWYAVAPHYTYSSEVDDRKAVNRTSITDDTISSSRLTLDGTDDVVALIIAPGEALGFQDRNANHLARNFLEDDNEDTDNKFSSTPADNPDMFNDRVIAITHDELMLYIGSTVATEIKSLLDTYYQSQPEPKHYPGNADLPVEDYHDEFADLLDDHPWLDNDTTPNFEQWVAVIIYKLNSASEVSIQYAGCPGMSFTLVYGAAITRIGNSCQASL